MLYLGPVRVLGWLALLARTDAAKNIHLRHTKIAGKQVLRRGLSRLVTTINTMSGAPVVAGIRLRAGRASSGKGAASMVRDAVRAARAACRVSELCHTV